MIHLGNVQFVYTKQLLLQAFPCNIVNQVKPVSSCYNNVIICIDRCNVADSCGKFTVINNGHSTEISIDCKPVACVIFSQLYVFAMASKTISINIYFYQKMKKSGSWTMAISILYKKNNRTKRILLGNQNIMP